MDLDGRIGNGRTVVVSDGGRLWALGRRRLGFRLGFRLRRLRDLLLAWFLRLDVAHQALTLRLATGPVGLGFHDAR